VPANTVQSNTVQSNTAQSNTAQSNTAQSNTVPVRTALADTVLTRTVELARIPAPTGSEHDRAAVVRRWWEEDGRRPRTDDAGNVWAQAGGGDGPGLLVCAHLDTVFPATVPHVVITGAGRLSGPSVGDDSIGVASLAAVARLAPPGPGTGPLWLVATVGEEGTGNLAGIRYALDHAPQPVAAVIAIEGNYLGRVVITGVGSVRWRVSYHGPGGHAWERSGAPSAVHAAVHAGAQLAGLDVAGARCSVNIGTIGGGEAINARAREAWFEVDLRADSAAALASLAGQAGAIVRAADDQIRVRIDEIGSRPAGGVAGSSALVRAAVAAHERAGVPVELGAASTDANAAYAAGIPAVALGVTRGEGEHTPEEWIETAPVADGLGVLAETIRLFREGQR
jgi:acetylornithine deacetylase/succinyl-diaminopimelate desuccinylase-like protein